MEELSNLGAGAEIHYDLVGPEQQNQWVRVEGYGGSTRSVLRFALSGHLHLKFLVRTQ